MSRRSGFALAGRRAALVDGMGGRRAGGQSVVAAARAAPVRVVVVDDSLLMREMLQSALTEAGGIAVVGTAADPHEARAVIHATGPDVVTLNVEMPGMGGLEFLRRIMDLRPMPVVMVAGRTTSGAETTLAALEIGAVDFVSKPGGPAGWADFAAEVRDKVRGAAGVRFDRPATTAATASGRPPAMVVPNFGLIAVGASTGGVAAINRLVSRLPAGAPPVIIAQHMPPGFTARFAARLARTTGLDVAEASDREGLRKGTIRLAPGGRHLRVSRQSGRLVCRIGDDAPARGHRPAVDVLFASVALTLGERALGVILTGMGSDGAQGLKKMRAAGAHTIGEAEASCIVYGMPGAAMRLGAVAEELEIDALATRLRGLCAGGDPDTEADR